jgi:hypothetical protein
VRPVFPHTANDDLHRRRLPRIFHGAHQLLRPPAVKLFAAATTGLRLWYANCKKPIELNQDKRG